MIRLLSRADMSTRKPAKVRVDGPVAALSIPI